MIRIDLIHAICVISFFKKDGSKSGKVSVFQECTLKGRWRDRDRVSPIAGMPMGKAFWHNLKG